MSGVFLLLILALLAVAVWPARPELGWPVTAAPVAAPHPRGRWPWPASTSATTPPATPHGVADALVLVSLALRSGMGQREALERVAQASDGKIADHLRSVAAALRWGQPVHEAWGYVPAVWRPAALAWEVAETAGAGPAQLVEEAAARIREREDRRLQAAGARAGVRLVLPLGLAFLPAFACTAVVPVVLALAHTVLGP